MSDAIYFLPDGYTPNLRPAYYVDEGDDLWQEAVYQYAAALASRLRVPHCVDLGCGRGGKTARYLVAHNRKAAIGVDHGQNYQLALWARPITIGTAVPQALLQFVDHDLNSDAWLPVNTDNALIVCADVLEHLETPEILLERIAQTTANAMVFSTPDRALLYDAGHLGPPGNPAHVREWAADEFKAFVIRWFGKGWAPEASMHVLERPDSAREVTYLLSLVRA